MSMNPVNPVNRADVPPPGENVANDVPRTASASDALPVSSTVVASRDRVRWGPIWAGTVATFVVFLTLEVLMVALGLMTPVVNGVAVNPGVTAVVVTAIVGVIAFFIGGWLAGATSSVRGTDAGVLDGLMVWGLSVALIFGLGLLGASSVLGVIGNILAQFLGRGVTAPGMPVDTGVLAASAQTAAVGVFFGLILSAVAAALGGWMASLSDPIGHLFRPRELLVQRSVRRPGNRLPA